MDHKEFSSRGGKVSSPAKTAAARANAKKPRGRWATAIAYEYISDNGTPRSGLILLAGKCPDKNFWPWAEKQIVSDIGNDAFPIKEVLWFDTKSRLI